MGGEWWVVGGEWWVVGGEWMARTRWRAASGVPWTESGVARGGDMGYLQSKLSYDLYVDMLVRPTRIPPRQSGDYA